MLPSTRERAFVQVKSETTQNQYEEYFQAFGESRYDRMFFVYHTGETVYEGDRVTVIGPERLSEMILDAGLVSWLINKVS